MIVQPLGPVELTCFVDADFARKKDPKLAMLNLDPARLRSGFILFLAGAPLYWSSKMQKIISLLTAERKFIALLEAT